MVNDTGLWITLAVVALILGVLAGHAAFPTIETEYKDKLVEVPYQVNVTITELIPLNAQQTYLNPAVQEVLNYLDDEELLVCNGVEYNLDEVSIVKTTPKDYSIAFDDKDYTVNSSVKLNFKTEDETRCRETYNFSVFYEDSEDPEVTLI